MIEQPPRQNIPFGGMTPDEGHEAERPTLPACVPRHTPHRLHQPAARRHSGPRRSWSDLAASVVQSWPRTLRACTVLLVIVVGAELIATACKLNGQLLLALLGLRVRRRR